MPPYGFCCIGLSQQYCCSARQGGLPSGSHAPALVVIHKSRQTENAVIPAGMQESSAMDGNSPLCKCLIQDTHQPADSPPCDWIPAVHAGMTGFNHLCITTRAGAWEPAQKQKIRQGSRIFYDCNLLNLAERQRFELWEGINLQRFSRPPP